jgi:hypothetical protein
MSSKLGQDFPEEDFNESLQYCIDLENKFQQGWDLSDMSYDKRMSKLVTINELEDEEDEEDEEDYIAYDEGLDYKFNEGVILEEVVAYINGTYSQHYAQEKIQSLEVIMDAGHGEGFMIGSNMKYLKRLGKKEGVSKRKDLLKIIHYSILMINLLDEDT